MTPNEIHEACKKLAAKAGPKADVYVSISSNGRLSGSIYTKGITGGDSRDVSSYTVHSDDPPTFADLFHSLEAKWRVEDEKRGGRIIEKMALEIIRLTAEFGSCSDAALRAEFGEHVAKHGDAALSRANEMAANGPFEIVSLSGANSLAA